MGSYLTGQPRFAWRRGQRLWSSLLVAALALLLAALGHHFDFMLEHGWWWRLLGVCLGLFPLGFFLGMPFPLGIARAAREKRQADVPLYFAVNAAGTVVGAVLAVGLSLELGFSVVMSIGASLYLGLFAAIRG